MKVEAVVSHPCRDLAVLEVLSVIRDERVMATLDLLRSLCFAEVDGYSRIGKYKGNGSADGTFVYTGFRPAWLWIKSTTANRENVIFDNKRNAFNVTNEGMSLRGYAETTDYGILDFLSNGFKLRASTNHSNENGQDIIYIAFAEAPFKFANAR